MSAVVLRCPNCGTTGAAPGECEACHEAALRYYCPNHPGGRWLDGPSCAACGARFGVEPPAPPRPHPTPPPRRRPTPRSSTPRSVSPAPPPAEPPRGRPTRERMPRDRYEELFEEMLRGRATGRGEVGEPWSPGRPAEPAPIEVGPPGGWPPAAPERVVRARMPSVGGCLVRLVVVLVLFALLAIAAVVGLVGGPIGAFMVDFGQSTGVLEGVPAQTERGIAAFEARDYETAERELREAARAYPRSGLALVYLARLEWRSGDELQARELLREAIAREPTSAVAHRALADRHYAAALRLGGAREADGAARPELLGALEHYQQAFALDPRDTLARSYAECIRAALDAPPDSEAAAPAECSGPGVP